MTTDDILRMAREQGLPETETEGVFRVNADDLGRILAAEREECAKVCEAISDEYHRREGLKYPEMKTDAETGASDCEAAIRARGKT